jgi:aldose 1-epimerase
MSLPDLQDGEIELRCGALLARVRRDVGGAMSGFWRMDGTAAVPILRPAAASPTTALQMSSFPLVPFCNRIENGRFKWEGQVIKLSPNDPNDEYPLHGYGWKSAWSVIERTAERVELHWTPESGEWPWAFEAHQSIALQPDALQIDLSVVNRDTRPMPAGLGHHPYYPLTQHTRFTADVEFKCETNARLIPTQLVPVPKGGIFGDRRTPYGHSLDNTFVGWKGPALIEQRDPPIRIEITADPAHSALAVFVPPHGEFLCVEPVTNVPNALNEPKAAVPLRTLASGEGMHSSMRIAVK